MAEMSADEKLVRAAWESIDVEPRRNRVRCWYGGQVYWSTKDWSAAAFTRQRNCEIAELREEIEFINGTIADSERWAELLELPRIESKAIPERILARLQSALAELTRGMKEAHK